MKKNLADDSGIDWDAANIDNLKLMVQEYDRELAALDKSYQDLEAKSRWILSLAISLISAVGVFALSKLSANVLPLQVPLFAFTASMFAAAWCSGLSLTAQDYSSGKVIPKSISTWKPFVEGDNDTQKRFYGAKIRNLALSVQVGQVSNRNKAAWLNRAIFFSVLSPIAALLAAALVLLLRVPISLS